MAAGRQLDAFFEQQAPKIAPVLGQLTATSVTISVSNAQMTDKALVSRALEGDVKAFELLVRQNQKLVAHMVGRIIDRQEEREDICQEVFMKVYQHLGEFNFQSRLSTWIATIAYRNAINHVRKHKPRFYNIDNEAESLERFHAIALPENDYSDKDAEEQLMKLVEELPVQYKSVLTLYHLEEKNYAEIAEITGMPEGTVKNYLFRARHLLKEKATKYLAAASWK